MSQAFGIGTAGMRSGGAGGRSTGIVMALVLLASAILHAAPAQAAINSMSITGGTGTVTVGSTLYARQGQTVNVTVVTDTVPCEVRLTGAHSAILSAPSSSTATTKTWNFGPFTVADGDGTRTVTAATMKLHTNGKCQTNDSTSSGSYVADNTKPAIGHTVTAGAPNGAGWSRQDVTVNWSGSDGGSGFVELCTGTPASRNPNPCSSSQTAETSGTTLSSAGVDRVGNSQTGSVVVRLDKTPPTLNVPAPFSAEATSASGASVHYSTSAGDSLSGPSVITPSCAPASGSTFPLGSTLVSCSATDVAGNTALASFSITVQDTVGPVFSNVPEIAAAEGDTLGGKVVTFTDPTATDAVSGIRSVSCLPASGSTFPVATTLVTCSATDAAGNPGSASFNVIVSDTTEPILALPADFDTEATGPGGAQVSYMASADDVVDGPITPSCSPTSGMQLALGSHAVGCTATDNSGNMAIGSFTARVVDTSSPVFGAAPSVGPFEATGPSGAVVTYNAPAAEDVVDGTVTGSCLPASNTTLAIGTHTVTCTASDNAGNAATPLEFWVTVQDTTKPVFSGVPGNQTLEATGAAGAAARFTAPTATDLVDGTRTVTCDHQFEEIFPIGETTVTCSASDTSGNSSEVGFTVTIEDTTAPTLHLPADMTVNATSAAGAEVSYTATATDLVDPAVTPDCTPASGSLFGVGTTIVMCDASDTRGNRATTASFTVTVQPWLTYSFGGFERPVDPQPMLNRAKAGSSIPVKFSLGGDHGLDIWAANPNGTFGPTSGVISCNAGAPVDQVEETVSAGSSGLRYDAFSNSYTYVWKTDAKWTGCRQLVLRFKDGTVQRADFTFTK